MKMFFLITAIVLATCRGFAEGDSSKVAEILKSSSARELSKAATHATSSKLRARGCEIQQRVGVPPTLCYPSRESEVLDTKCARASRTAVHLPKVDEFTSSLCRDAIEKRSADLAYASHRDASR